MKYLASNKDKRKLIRSIIQGLILLLLIGLLFNAIFNFKEYKDYSVTSTVNNNEDKGFVALSYFGVDRNGTNTMISSERLEEHFQALNKNGYIALSQENIEDYYYNNKMIPKKSMFLMFEDGRKDTVVFSSPLLEKYNYIGTILSYGNKLKDKDPTFLSPKDLKELEESTFWQMGSNGYRLAYINVFDSYNNYLGELNSEEYSRLSKSIGENYNHYLMDFIRDENRIPKENYEQMEERINKDYILMEEVYKEELGKMPKVYALMHSNTGQYGSNKNVSRINEELIKKNFTFNFNREGSSLNHKKTDVYNLTRIQVQPYWYPNHLLMRIRADINEDIIFIEGDPNIKKDWDMIKGVTEFRKSSIIVTSEPEGRGLIRLNKNNNYQNYTLATRLRGNKLGSQRIYLRADEELKEYLSIEIKNNNLYIEEDGKEIFSLDLNEHDGITLPPIEIEDMGSRGKEFTPQIEINELGNRKLHIHLEDNKLSVDIDNKVAVKDLIISSKNSGYIYLQSACGEYGYSQRNIADDVYDGVFQDLIIRDINNEDEVLYMNKLEGKELIKEKILNRWNRIINWFIKNL